MKKMLPMVFVLALAFLFAKAQPGAPQREWKCGESGWTDSCYLQVDEATCTILITVLCCHNVMESYDLELYPSATREAAAQATCTVDGYESDPRGTEGDLLQDKETHPRLKTIMFSAVASFMLAAIVISVIVTCYCRRREIHHRRDEAVTSIQCTQESPLQWTWAT